MLRRYCRLAQDSGLRVYVLSAKFGLIPANLPIPIYDLKMNTKVRLQSSTIRRGFSIVGDQTPQALGDFPHLRRKDVSAVLGGLTSSVHICRLPRVGKVNSLHR